MNTNFLPFDVNARGAALLHEMEEALRYHMVSRTETAVANAKVFVLDARSLCHPPGSPEHTIIAQVSAMADRLGPASKLQSQQKPTPA